MAAIYLNPAPIPQGLPLAMDDGAVGMIKVVPRHFTSQQLASIEVSCISDLVKGVQQHYDMPMCFVALPSSDGIHFKARYNFPTKFLPRRPGDDSSIFLRTVVRKSPRIIEDAQGDTRFKKDPFVCGAPFIRLHISVPLIVGNRECIGSMCLMDAKPRSHVTLDYCSLAMQAAEEIASVIKTIQQGRPAWEFTIGSLPDISANVNDTDPQQINEEDDDISDSGSEA